MLMHRTGRVVPLIRGLDWEKTLIGCLPSSWDLGETGQGMKELLEAKEMVRTWKTRGGHSENAAS